MPPLASLRRQVGMWSAGANENAKETQQMCVWSMTFPGERLSASQPFGHWAYSFPVGSVSGPRAGWLGQLQTWMLVWWLFSPFWSFLSTELRILNYEGQFIQSVNLESFEYSIFILCIYLLHPFWFQTGSGALCFIFCFLPNLQRTTKIIRGPPKEKSSWPSSLIPWGVWFIENHCRGILVHTWRKLLKKISPLFLFSSPSSMLDENSIGPLRP